MIWFNVIHKYLILFKNYIIILNSSHLLRPLSRFYNLLNMIGALIIWTLVVFAWAITYTYYTTISSASVSTLAIIVLVYGLVSSPWIIICIHMFYRIYMNTVKSVFSKAYYPDKYMKTDNDVDNSIECAVPVGCNVPADKSQQQVRSRQFNDDRQSNFEFEGGDDSKYLPYNILSKHPQNWRKFGY